MPGLILLWLALIVLIRGMGIRTAPAAMLATAAALSRPLTVQTILVKDDLLLAAFFAAAVAGCTERRLREPLAPWRIGAAVGLFFAAKYTALLSAPLLLLVIVVGSWILPNSRAALQFTEAEVAFLFPAPVSRRKLIHFKLLRSQIAMVPQESFLFSMTLADNVAFGLPRTEPEAVERAARRAQLAKDVDELPERYETVVGERGVMLSGGQRQRTALARALALDPRILILDDTLSAVDAQTEVEIQRELERVFEGRTVIVALHDLTLAARFAQRILLLKDGREVAVGAPEAVLSPERLATAYGIRATFGRIAGVPVVLPVEPLT